MFQNGASTMDGGGAEECFRCGEVGHWSSGASPSLEALGMVINHSVVACTKQVASGSGSGTGGTCFKCGIEGHWSNGSSSSIPTHHQCRIFVLMVAF